MLNVIVSGSGHMGSEILAALGREADMTPVGVIEKFSTEKTILLPDGSGSLPLSNEPGEMFARVPADVVVDFTNTEWTPLVAMAALRHGVRPVIGTSGLSDGFVADLSYECRAKGVGGFIAPNFAIGAVLMIHLAKTAARFFDYVDITEMHQEKKVDAPSGTAVATAKDLVDARGKPFEHNVPDKLTLPGSRGAEYEGVNIHSRRLPGLVAHQEIVFGGQGQTLTIRHDSTGRDSFIPGVLLAVRAVMERNDLVVGLENLIGL
jgi:4-hydroxy-tetrahydrodipicolinate reductase